MCDLHVYLNIYLPQRPRFRLIFCGVHTLFATRRTVQAELNREVGRFDHRPDVSVHFFPVVTMIPTDFPGGVTFLCRSDGVGVVKSQNHPGVPVMKTQGIPDAVWNVRFCVHPPRLKLGPIAVFHGKDFTVQIQQSGTPRRRPLPWPTACRNIDKGRRRLRGQAFSREVWCAPRATGCGRRNDAENGLR